MSHETVRVVEAHRQHFSSNQRYFFQVEDEVKTGNGTIIEPMYYDNSSATIISSKDIKDIEDDLQRMRNKPEIKKLFAELPKIRYYSDLVLKCYNEKFYDYFYSGRYEKITCPGPQYCDFKQHPDITCMRVNATHIERETLSPVTYYYAKDPYFTDKMGCYAH